MRSRLSSDLVVLLLAIAICRSPAFGSGPKLKAKLIPGPVAPIKTWEVKGYGVTEALARKNALDSVHDDILGWLNNHHPEITYQPSPAEVESMVRGFSPAIPWERPNKDELHELDHEQILEVTLKVELMDSDLAAFQKQTLHQVSQQRQTLLGKGLIGALGLLVVATGYLRLEEKVGRHKRKLGLAAMGALGLIGLVSLALLVMN